MTVEVLHPVRDLFGPRDGLRMIQRALLAVDVVIERTVGHQLRDDVSGVFRSGRRVEQHHVWVARQHAQNFGVERSIEAFFDGNFDVSASLPLAGVDGTVCPLPQLLAKLQLLQTDDVAAFGAGTQVAQTSLEEGEECMYNVSIWSV